MIPLLLRTIEAGDVHFVLKSWLKSYRNSCFATEIPNEVYFRSHRALILRLLDDRSVTMMAVNAEDEDQILGFVCYSPGVISECLVLHFIYVKSPFRRFGIGHRLLEAAKAAVSHERDLPIVVSHANREFKRFYKDLFVYNPYMIRTSSEA